MALLLVNEDGTYASLCSICGEPLAAPVFATTHFIADQKHHLWRFSDSAMHWNCYAGWEHQQEFAALYFEVATQAEKSEYWVDVLRSDPVFVQFGTFVQEMSVVLRRTGSTFRIPAEGWEEWLECGWRNACGHKLEEEALAEVMELVREAKRPK